MKMKMKLLIQLFGETRANAAVENLKTEVPGMHEDYYVRNVIRTLRTY